MRGVAPAPMPAGHHVRPTYHGNDGPKRNAPGDIQTLEIRRRAVPPPDPVETFVDRTPKKEPKREKTPPPPAEMDADVPEPKPKIAPAPAVAVQQTPYAPAHYQAPVPSTVGDGSPVPVMAFSIFVILLMIYLME